MENLRARTRKEVESASVYSISKLAKDLLNIVDVFELALKSVPSSHITPSGDKEKLLSDADVASLENISHSLKDLFSGVELTYHELVSVLKRHGVEEFEVLNAPFDPNFHAALYEVPTPKEESSSQPPSAHTEDSTNRKQMVIDVHKKGYKLKDRVIRPAQVGISK
jgi:molecular chaperone GrpE